MSPELGQPGLTGAWPGFQSLRFGGAWDTCLVGLGKPGLVAGVCDPWQPPPLLEHIPGLGTPGVPEARSLPPPQTRRMAPRPGLPGPRPEACSPRPAAQTQS